MKPNKELLDARFRGAADSFSNYESGKVTHALKALNLTAEVEGDIAFPMTYNLHYILSHLTRFGVEFMTKCLSKPSENVRDH